MFSPNLLWTKGLTVTSCMDFSPLLSHHLTNFKTQMIQLNLTGARGLKNTYVLTSSRKKEHI